MCGWHGIQYVQLFALIVEIYNKFTDAMKIGSMGEPWINLNIAVKILKSEEIDENGKPL